MSIVLTVFLDLMFLATLLDVPLLAAEEAAVEVWVASCSHGSSTASDLFIPHVQIAHVVFVGGVPYLVQHDVRVIVGN